MYSWGMFRALCGIRSYNFTPAKFPAKAEVPTPCEKIVEFAPQTETAFEQEKDAVILKADSVSTSDSASLICNCKQNSLVTVIAQ